MIDTKALREKVLDLAIRGKLVPQDPNDEPASLLLERIRAQKQQMVKDGKLKAKDIKDDTVIFKGEDNLHYEKFADGTVKCIEDEIPFDLPKGWEWSRLGVLFAHNTGKALNSSNTEGAILSYITTSNLYWDRFELTNLKEMPFTKSELEKCTVCKGDLLVCEGGDIGRAAIWMYDENIRIQNHIHRLRPYVELCNRFYYYVFYLWKQCGRIGGNGIGLQGFSSKALHNLIIPLPPVKEQKRIVKELDLIASRIVCLDELKSDLGETISKAKSKILDLAIRGKLVPQDPNDEPASVLLEHIRAEKEELIRQGKIKRDKKDSVIFKGEDNSYYEKIGSQVICIDNEIPFELPDGWMWCRLGTIGEWRAGTTPNRSNSEYYNGNIPWLKTGDLNDNYITCIPETITDLALKETSIRLNPAGSVLIAMYGATIGKLGMLTFPAATNQACCACFPLDEIEIEYLFYYLLSQRDYFINRGVGGAQSNISKEKIIATLMPVPPYTEQKRMLEDIKALNEIISNIEQNLS